MNVTRPVTEIPPDLKQFGETVLTITFARVYSYVMNGLTDPITLKSLDKEPRQTVVSLEKRAKRLNDSIYTYIERTKGSIYDYLSKVAAMTILLDPSRSVAFKGILKSSPIALVAISFYNRIFKRDDAYLEVPGQQIEEQVPELFNPGVDTEVQRAIIKAMTEHFIPWRTADIYASFYGLNGPPPIEQDYDWIIRAARPISSICTDESYENPVTVVPDADGSMYCVDLRDLVRRFAMKEYVNPMTGNKLDDDTIESIMTTYGYLIEREVIEPPAKPKTKAPPPPKPKKPKAVWRVKKPPIPPKLRPLPSPSPSPPKPRSPIRSPKLRPPPSPPKPIEEIRKRSTPKVKFSVPEPVIYETKMTTKNLGDLMMTDELAETIFTDYVTRFYHQHMGNENTDELDKGMLLDAFLNEMFLAYSESTLRDALYQIALLDTLMKVPYPSAIKRNAFHGREFGELALFLKRKVEYGIYGGEKLAYIEFDEAFPELAFSDIPKKKDLISGIKRIVRSTVETWLQSELYKLNPTIRRKPSVISDPILIRDIDALADESTMCSNEIFPAGGMEDLVICDEDGKRVCYSIDDLADKIRSGKATGLGDDFTEKVMDAYRAIDYSAREMLEREALTSESVRRGFMKEVVGAFPTMPSPEKALKTKWKTPLVSSDILQEEFVPDIIPEFPRKTPLVPIPRTPEPASSDDTTFQDLLADIRKPPKKMEKKERVIPRRKWRKIK
jgi:hypothetical protein